MRVLFDAFALIAYLRDEPAATDVQRALWHDDVAISAVHLAEVVDRMSRVYGVEAVEVEVIVSALNVVVVAIDQQIGALAGAIRSRRYIPTDRTLSLADAVCIAAAVDTGRTPLTADPVLISALGAEGGRATQLPAAN